jgi:hypothetical protein
MDCFISLIFTSAGPNCDSPARSSDLYQLLEQNRRTKASTISCTWRIGNRKIALCPLSCVRYRLVLACWLSNSIISSYEIRLPSFLELTIKEFRHIPAQTKMMECTRAPSLRMKPRRCRRTTRGGTTVSLSYLIFGVDRELLVDGTGRG